MEVKFDIIKPNPYVLEDELYFGMDDSDVIPTGEFVKILSKNFMCVVNIITVK